MNIQLHTYGAADLTCSLPQESPPLFASDSSSLEGRRPPERGTLEMTANRAQQSGLTRRSLPAAVSPVIHIPVHGKHPQSDLRGDGAHLVSSINSQVFNNGFQEKEKGTTGQSSQ
ncbi:unnamed protein product [Pleuronectes platessa]|uniref:Uncharacterized protein n=1 Tax=Pleuronectes platessa TaxID=8262 RepID=A0A9N7U9Y1_PLEPL|nr:unnamed protein product [Pleuronectes platessa]